MQKYRSGWLKWHQWAAPKTGVPVISVSNNTGISHSLAGIVECPTSHPLVKSSLKGARRKLACPVQPKEPLSVDTVCRIADHYISSSSLDVIRFLFILLVGLAGFEENDQYREVHTSLLARSHKATCPVSITERLLKLLPSSTESSSLLVRPIVKSKSKEYFHATKHVSYTTLRERNLGNTLSHFVDDIASYGTHRIKSGAASNPACKSISADLLDEHAGWKCAIPKNRYIKHTVNDHLKVA